MGSSSIGQASEKIHNFDHIGAPLNVSKEEFNDESFFLSDKDFVMNHNKHRLSQFNFEEEMNLNSNSVPNSI